MGSSVGALLGMLLTLLLGVADAVALGNADIDGEVVASMELVGTALEAIEAALMLCDADGTGVLPTGAEALSEPVPAGITAGPLPSSEHAESASNAQKEPPATHDVGIRQLMLAISGIGHEGSALV